jgi:hypothetical protein
MAVVGLQVAPPPKKNSPVRLEGAAELLFLLICIRLPVPSFTPTSLPIQTLTPACVPLRNSSGPYQYLD